VQSPVAMFIYFCNKYPSIKSSKWK